jgi:hypothetical protein
MAGLDDAVGLARHGARGPPSLVRAGLASHPPVASGTGESRPGGAIRPCGRLGAAANAVATTVDRNTAAMSWMRPGRGVAGRVGGERVNRGWVGRAAPVLGPDPAVTLAGAGRHGPAGPGGGHGPGPPGRRAAADRDGGAGGESAGRRPRPPAGYRCRPRSRPSPPGVTVVFTLDPAGCTVVTLIG